MPITQLDRTSALVVIDLQKGITAMATAHPAPDVVAKAATLARGFRTAGRPVVLVNVAGGAPGRTDTPPPALTRSPDWTELAPELGAEDGDLRVTKYSWGAFYGTALEMHLRRRGVTQIVLCGISTSAGVESTARDAHARGYHVTFAADAMTDRVLESHEHSVTRIFPRLGEVGSTADVLARL